MSAGDRSGFAGLALVLSWLIVSLMYGLTVVALLAADAITSRVRRLRRWDGWSWRYPLIWGGLVLLGYAGLSVAVRLSTDRGLWLALAIVLGTVSLAAGVRDGATERWAVASGMLIIAAVAVAGTTVATVTPPTVPGRTSTGRHTPPVRARPARAGRGRSPRRRPA